MHTTGHCNSLSDLWSRLDMATLFPSHTDFHMVFFTVTAKNKQKTSLRYIIKRNTVWSDVQTGNNLESVVCMVSNRCQAPAVSLKYLNYPMVPVNLLWCPRAPSLRTSYSRVISVTWQPRRREKVMLFSALLSTSYIASFIFKYSFNSTLN